MTKSGANPPDEHAYWVLEAELPPRVEEIWSLFCFQRGSAGAEWLEEGPRRWRIRHFFPRHPGGTPEDWLRDFAARYPAVPTPSGLELRRRPVERWDTVWRTRFTPLPVGERLLICAPWHAPPAQSGDRDMAGRIRLIIDPGQGFGTGWHPSTALALLGLEHHLHPDRMDKPPERMADIGAGSGILAIAARLLGVAEAYALDSDGRVLPEIRRNFALNGLSSPQGLIRGGPECLRNRHPLVVANIVTPVLISHADSLAGLTDRTGCLILSGIQEEEREALLNRYARAGMHPCHEQRREGWYACHLHHR